MATDLELLVAWRTGDGDAGNQLFERYFDPLFRFFSNKVDQPQDLVQQTLVACVSGRDRLRGLTSFPAYVFRIARNRLSDHWKAQRREHERIDFSVSSVADLARSPSDVLGSRQEHRILLLALRALPIDDQMMLELHYWEQLPASVLAEVMDLAEGTVRSRLRRAKQLLHEKVLQLATTVELAASLTGNGLDTWARTVREYAGRELGTSRLRMADRVR